MASQAMASLAGLRGRSQGVIECNTRMAMARIGHNVVRAQQQVSAEPETSRRAVLGLVAAGLASGSFVQAVLAADAKPIKFGPPPPPSGGLPGTRNSDDPRDLDLPLKERYYLQPLSPSEAVARAKESANGIVGVKTFIEKKAWPYVQNDLRLKGEYLRYDLNTVISSKPKDEKKLLKELSGKLFQTIGKLDYAAKKKNPADAEKYYSETVSSLKDVLSKLG